MSKVVPTYKDARRFLAHLNKSSVPNYGMLIDCVNV